MRYRWNLHEKLWSVSNALETPSKREIETSLKTNDGGHAKGIFIAALLFLLLAGVMSQLGGCAAQPQYIVHRVACPPKPTLPIIMETELQGLSEAAYRRLVERELRLRAYVDQLEVGCKKE